MKRSSLGATWVGALAAAGAALLFQGSAARAQYSQCESDADCGAGYVCNEGSFESCDGGWTCDDEGNCTEVPGECTTYESNWCSNATCEADADCPSYMACQTQTTWVCDVSAGGAGGAAGGVAGAAGTFAGMAGIGGGAGEPSCHEEPAPSLCIARHQLPCEEASDCGGGFDCVESYYYECSGGGAGGSAGAAGMVAGAGGAGGVAGGMTGGSGGSDEPWECHQVPSGTFYCSLQNLPCESDAECAEGLSCEPYYEYPECVFVPGPGGEGGRPGGGAGTGSAGTGAGGSAGMVAGGAGGTAGMVAGAGGEAGGGDDGYWECPPPIETHRCQPIAPPGGGMGGAGGVGGGPAGGTGGASGDGEAGAAGMSTENPGSGSGGAGAGGGAGDDDGESDEHGNGHGHGRGRGLGLLKKLLGCSAGGPVEGNASMGWLMLGLAAVVLGRRTRRS
jgi:hypothetical protein